MPKVTKRKANKNDTPKPNLKDNKSLKKEDQPVITTVDKIDESTSQKGIKRKASSSVEKVNKPTHEIFFLIINLILEHKKSFNNQ